MLIFFAYLKIMG